MLLRLYNKILDYLFQKNNMYLIFAKLYLKRLDNRSIRLVFIGKRCKVKHYNWLHQNGHPWENKEQHRSE